MEVELDGDGEEVDTALRIQLEGSESNTMDASEDSEFAKYELGDLPDFQAEEDAVDERGGEDERELYELDEQKQAGTAVDAG